MKKMLNRGGKLTVWKKDEQPEGDRSWSADDWARAGILEARWRDSGVESTERIQLIPCAVVLYKWPGTLYSAEIMKRLKNLQN